MVSRFNEPITAKLLEGARDALARHGAADVDVVWVPGAWELPIAARRLLATDRYDALVAIGAVIRGETTHYELVSEGAADGIQRVQLATGVPIAMGLVTVETEAQALARSEGPGGHNVGEEAAVVAVEMARLVQAHPSS